MAEPPVDFQGVVDATDDVFNAAYDKLTNNGVPQYLALILAGFPMLIMLSGGLLFVGFVGALKKIVIPVAIAMVTTISEIRKAGAPEFAELAASTMGEFLGVEVDPSALSTGTGAMAQVQRMSVLGSALHDLLTQELGGNDDVTPESGAKAARVFSGFNMNFAAQNAIISVLFETLSLDYVTQVRELGVEMAENLGLGRLHRQAMRPLINTLITAPYQQWLNQKYTPTTLNEKQLMDAFQTGFIDEGDVDDELTKLGYRREYIEVIKNDHRSRLTPHECYDMVRASKMEYEEAIKMLQYNGWSRDFAVMKYDSVIAARVVSQWDTEVSEIVELAKHRFLTVEGARQLIASKGLDAVESEIIQERIENHVQAQHKSLTLAELLYLAEHSLITDQDFDDWMAEQGFRQKDANILYLWFTQKQLDWQAQQKAKEAKKKPPTPPVTK